MFIKNPEEFISNCNKEIASLNLDLKKVKGIVSEKVVKLIESEISANKIKIKEAELNIRYADYQ
jgi:hypothetical protein